MRRMEENSVPDITERITSARGCCRHSVSEISKRSERSLIPRNAFGRDSYSQKGFLTSFRDLEKNPRKSAVSICSCHDPSSLLSLQVAYWWHACGNGKPFRHHHPDC